MCGCCDLCTEKCARHDSYNIIVQEKMYLTKLGYVYFQIKYVNTPLDMTLSATSVDLFSKKA